MFHAFKVSLHCSFFFPIKFGGCLIWFDLGFLGFFFAGMVCRESQMSNGICLVCTLAFTVLIILNATGG